MILATTIKSKFEQFLRLVYINSITQTNGSIILAEYPKSGGTWLGQLISGYLQIPFPRNQFPITRRSLYHTHYLPKKGTLKNDPIIYLVRDGRDVMISQYFHQLIWNEKNKLNPKDVHYHRSKVPFEDYENIKENLFEYIKYTFEETPSKLQHFTYMGNWAEYNKAWFSALDEFPNVHLIKFEDLLVNTSKTLQQLFEKGFKIEVEQSRLEQVIDTYSFERQTKRDKGVEDQGSFLRKGISGDWKNYFGEREKELFKRFAGDVLIQLGYENDLQW